MQPLPRIKLTHYPNRLYLAQGDRNTTDITMTDLNSTLEGGCTCGEVRYRLRAAPLIVHCCHCRSCQRETGSAFVINALIESAEVDVLKSPPELINTPSASGKGQLIARCPVCHVAVWSHYAAAGKLTSFIRVGTLDQPDALPPDIHIFTSTRQPWVKLPDDATAVPEFYTLADYWPAASLTRLNALLAAAR